MDCIRSVEIPQKRINWKNRVLHSDRELTAINNLWMREHPPLLVHARVLLGKKQHG